MFARIVALLWLTCGCAFGQEISYNTSSGVLSIPSVQVGSAVYTGVSLQNTGNFTFTLQTVGGNQFIGTPLATYDIPTATLTLPAVIVGPYTFSVQMKNFGNFTFGITAASPVQTYTYYSKTAQYPQTATLVNGTLTMDGLHLTNFTFGGGATDASGTLAYWASPWNNINQPKVEAMLFCGADNKLAYVLIKSAADDPARVTRTPDQIVDAIHSAPQYDGMSVYRDCSGTFVKAWNNDLPAADYYLWPDVFTTYSYAYVANQLDGAASFYQPGVPSNTSNYLSITWHGGSPFEVWQ